MRVIRLLGTLLTYVLVGVAGGCGSSLPTYDWTGHDAAMAHLVEQAQAVETISGSCTIYLQQGGGGGTSLDGAIAARHPGHLRLRAWKFNHAAFDLTMTPEGLWVMSGGDSHDDSPDLRFDHVAGAWSLLSGEYFLSAVESATNSREHVVTGSGADGATVRSVIDRRTLLPLRFEYLDDQGVTRGSLMLDRHREIDGHVWPMRMTFLSDDARIVIVMRDVEINAEIPPAAFRPAARAVRQP